MNLNHHDAVSLIRPGKLRGDRRKIYINKLHCRLISVWVTQSYFISVCTNGPRMHNGDIIVISYIVLWIAFIMWMFTNTDAVWKLECGTWYHHPRRLQCVLSRNLIIFQVATWHYRCRHNLKNNCIWYNLQCCLLVSRSPSRPKPVMLTFDLQSRKGLFIKIVFFACIT